MLWSLAALWLLAQGIHADSEPYNATAAVHSESRVIRTLLADYDHRVRPLGTDTSKPGYGSVKVEVNLFLRSISNVNEANMEYTLQLTLRQSWKDPRLVFSHMGPDIPTFFVLTEGQQIWKPDTFFLNEKQAHRHTIDKPNTLFRLYKDGRVLYSVRLSMTLSCPMNLRSYPMDVQKCNLKLASYAYTTDDIEYVWKSDNPIQLNYDLVNSLPQFTLSNYSSADCTSVTNTGRYSCLQMDIELTREYDYFIIHLFAPSTMLVIVSWVSFWLDVTAVPGRVTLGVTTLLTMTTKSSGVNAKLPPVSYTKAIDVWIGLCMAFLFGSLLEFALVTYLHSADIAKKKKENDGKDCLLKDTDDDQYTPPLKPKSRGVLDKIAICSGIMERYHRDRARTVDYLSRFIFPVLFFSCNALFWWRY